MKYDEKTFELSKMLGAEKFQKIVFYIEKLKYKIIEKFFPNIDKFYNNWVDKIRDKKLKKCNNELEYKKIIEEYRLKKIRLKKEITTKKNRNYHIDLNKPNEIKEYLELNKKIHAKNLKVNFISIIIIVLLSLFTSNLFINILFVFQVISGIINFQCINLQNYNLCRLENEKTKRILKKIEERNNEYFDKKMKQGAKIIGNSFRQTKDLPSNTDIVNNITSKKEAIELLEYLKRELKNKQKIKELKK